MPGGGNVVIVGLGSLLRRAMGRHKKIRRGTTTIMVSIETKEMLDKLKEKGQPYDAFIAKLLYSLQWRSF